MILETMILRTDIWGWHGRVEGSLVQGLPALNSRPHSSTNSPGRLRPLWASVSPSEIIKLDAVISESPHSPDILVIS